MEDFLMDDEILLVDKPAGMSSFGVVARVRRKLSEATGKKVKVGHTGTLDPFATGLLVLLVGKGTKRANEFLKLDKEYIATVRLGATSTTGDPEGEVTEVVGGGMTGAEVEETKAGFAGFVPPSREEARRAVGKFLGKIRQRVPNFSAVKINGQRAYKLARAGKTVEMPVREVTVHEAEILRYEWPELMVRWKVSSGTYIRTLGEDVGKELGVGGYLTALRRTQVGKYRVEEAVQLEKWMDEDEISADAGADEN